MRTLRAVKGGVRALSPFVNILRSVERSAQQIVTLEVIPADSPAAGRLREIVGLPERPPSSAGPLLAVCGVGDDVDAIAVHLVAAKRAGRRALLIMVGTDEERRTMQQQALTHRPLELSNMVHLSGLVDVPAIQRRLTEVLGSQIVEVAGAHPQLRDAVADTLIAQASRQASTIGAAVLVPGADTPVLTMLQVRLVAQLAAVYGRPLDARRGFEIAGVLISALGWKRLARRALAIVPIARFAVRAGVAYSGTRAVGEACKAYFSVLGDRADVPLAGLANALNGALTRKGQ